MFRIQDRIVPVGDKTLLPTSWLIGLVGVLATATMVAAVGIYGLFDMASQRSEHGMADVAAHCYSSAVYSDDGMIKPHMRMTNPVGRPIARVNPD